MFRMSRESFNILLGLLQDDLVRQDTKFRLAIPPAKRLAIALFYLHDGNMMMDRKKVIMLFMMISWMSVQSHKQKMDGFERDKAANGMPVPLSLRLLPWYSATLF